MARSRHSATAVVKDALKRLEKPEPAAAAATTAEMDRSSLERRWGVRRGVCKDAGAQTDLTPKAGNRLLGQLHELERARSARTPSVGDGKQHTIAEELVREVLQFSGGREAEDRPARGLSRYAPHAVPDVGFRPFEEIQSYGRDWDLLDQRESFGERDGALLSWDFQDPPAESINCASRHNHTYEDHYRIENPGGIPENMGFENIEEFIQRIEDEAAMPHGEVEDAWSLPEGEFGAVSCPGSRPLDFGGEGNAAPLSTRDLFSLRGHLLAPDSTAIPDEFSQKAGLLRPYPLEDQEAGLSLTSVWQERGML